MSGLGPLLQQPFREASNRGFGGLLLAGVALLALAALVGRHPLVAAAVVAYLLSIPAFVVYRIRTWNESLADVEAREAREEASVAGVDDEREGSG